MNNETVQCEFELHFFPPHWCRKEFERGQIENPWKKIEHFFLFVITDGK